jgi:hypothetical protein
MDTDTPENSVPGAQHIWWQLQFTLGSFSGHHLTYPQSPEPWPPCCRVRKSILTGIRILSSSRLLSLCFLRNPTNSASSRDTALKRYPSKDPWNLNETVLNSSYYYKRSVPFSQFLYPVREFRQVVKYSESNSKVYSE